MTKVLTNKNGKIVVWGDGSEERDLLYVSDLADFVEIVLRRQKEKFELVNVGLGKGFTVKDVVSNIIKASGKKIKMEFDTTKPTIKFNLSVNTAKAQKKYNWKPKTSLADGIKKTIVWYNRNIL